MSRRIFIMQRNVTDTGWETKTISGNGQILSTDSTGGLAMGQYVVIESSSRITDKDRYFINEPFAQIDFVADSAATASLFLSGSNGPTVSYVHIGGNGNGGGIISVNTGGSGRQIISLDADSDEAIGLILLRSAVGPAVNAEVHVFNGEAIVGP